MGYTNAFLYVFTGLLAGLLSGFIGSGGGVIIIPILVIFSGLSPKNGPGNNPGFISSAHRHSLAAWTYYKQGYVDFPIAGLICVGFIFGGLIGAKFATNLSNQTLEKIFGIALLIISIKMIFAKLTEKHTNDTTAHRFLHLHISRPVNWLL